MAESVVDLEALHAPHAELIRHALAELSPPGARLAVDIGCGPGLKAGWLVACLAPGGLALGLDIERGALAQARRRGLGALAGDAHALPLRSGAADLAWMVAVLGQLAQPAAALAEARRALRPGGALVLLGAGELWARPRAWPSALAAALAGAALPGPADGLAADLVDLLAGAGFVACEARAYLLDPPGLVPAAARLPLLAWPDLAPIVAGRLAPAELAACAVAEAAAEPAPLPVLLAAVARAEERR